jgi:hypothetical protein
MVSGRRPLGAYVRGSSAWIIHQLLQDSLPSRIRQLELDPGVHRDVVRQLRGTAADLELAAREYRVWFAARSAAESAEVPRGRVAAGSDRPPRWVDTGSAAASLGCTVRWITQLCLVGRLAAVKVGRVWSIDPESVQVYRQRGGNAV